MTRRELDRYLAKLARARDERSDAMWVRLIDDWKDGQRNVRSRDPGEKRRHRISDRAAILHFLASKAFSDRVISGQVPKNAQGVYRASAQVIATDRTTVPETSVGRLLKRVQRYRDRQAKVST